MSEYVQMLNDINAAGWHYASEWVGNGAIFQVRRSKRDAWQTFIGANPAEAAARAWDAIKPEPQLSFEAAS